MSYLIETARLGMRQFTLEDAEAVYHYSQDPKVTRYTGDADKIKSIEDARTIIETVWLAEYQKYGYARYALVHKGDNKVIGFCGWKFMEEEGLPDLGYRMLPQYWGQGLGMEAAIAAMQFGRDTLGLTQVFAEVVPENQGSVRIIEKLGFQFDSQYHYCEAGFDEQVRKYVLDLRQWQLG